MLEYAAIESGNLTMEGLGQAVGLIRPPTSTQSPDGSTYNTTYNAATYLSSFWNETTTDNDVLLGPDIRTCQYLATHCKFRIAVDIFVVSFLCIAGVLGNTIAIIVLRTDNINKMVSFLLQALAVADNAYLITCFGFQTLKALSECTSWIPGFGTTFPYVEQFIWPFASIAQMSAVWLVVLVTMDRYMAICRPFDRLRVWLTLYARRVAFVIPLIALLYNLPRFWEQIPRMLENKCTGEFKVWLFHSELRQNKIYYIVYKVCMFFVFRMTIPMSILVVLNVKLIQTLTVAKKDRAKLTLAQVNPRKDSFTIILVAVVTSFICCQTPDFVLRVIAIMKYFAGFKMDFEYINTITNLLLTVNSSINCLIYCLTGRRFRCILKRLLCRKCAKLQDGQRLSLMDEGMSSENTSVIRRHKPPTMTTETSLFFPQQDNISDAKNKCPSVETPFVTDK